MTDFNKVFIDAVRSTDCELLEMAIAGGADIHALQEKEPFDSSPLLPVPVGVKALEWAINVTRDRELKAEHLQIVRRLVDIGVDVNSKQHLDVSSYPIQKAVHAKHKALFDLLVELGATFWITGSEGAELIRWAGSHGLDWLVSQFLAKMGPIPPDEMVRSGLESALYGAAQYGHLETVRMLLDFGVDVDPRKSESSALTTALAGGRHAVAQLLLHHGANRHTEGDRGSTILIAAAQGGATELALELLEDGADPNAHDFYNRTPLHGAAASGDERLARELMRRGANIRARDNGNNSILHSAAYGGNKWIIEACLDAGVGVNAEDDWGYTPLMKAARNGQIEAMEVLVARGANVRHIAHYENETALNYAITAGHADAVRWFLEKGADVEQITYDNGNSATPLGLAAAQNDVELARLLVSFGALLVPIGEEKTSTPLHHAAWMNAVEVASFLLSVGAPEDVRDEDGNVPLLCVPGPDVARLLLEAGANPNERHSTEGFTKLWLAANYGLDDLAEVLLKFGADPSLRDSRTNRTPREVASDNNQVLFLQMWDDYFAKNS